MTEKIEKNMHNVSTFRYFDIFVLFACVTVIGLFVDDILECIYSQIIRMVFMIVLFSNKVAANLTSSSWCYFVVDYFVSLFLRFLF